MIHQETILSTEWIARLQGFNRLIVGYSGGVDSTVLLHALTEIPLFREKLLAVHIHHGLSPDADTWENQCRLFCKTHGIPYEAHFIQFPKKSNLEHQARNARKAIFSTYLTQESCLILGHHAQDQVETMLLNVCRGSGLNGLKGILPMLELDQGVVVRPLLQLNKSTLYDYAHIHNLPFVEDESNQSINFSRNYMRHEVIPVLTARWPALFEKFGQCAQHLQIAAEQLRELAYLDCPALKKRAKNIPLSADNSLSHDRLANILRTWFFDLNITMPSTDILRHMIHDVLLAKQDAMPAVHWGTWTLRRYQDQVYITNALTIFPDRIQWEHFPNPLRVGKTIFYAHKDAKGIQVPLYANIELRRRVGGESIYHHAHMRSVKKILQQKKLPPWERASIPLLFVNDELAMIVDFCVRDPYDHAIPLPCYRIERQDDPL